MFKVKTVLHLIHCTVDAKLVASTYLLEYIVALTQNLLQAHICLTT